MRIMAVRSSDQYYQSYASFVSYVNVTSHVNLMKITVVSVYIYVVIPARILNRIHPTKLGLLLIVLTMIGLNALILSILIALILSRSLQARSDPCQEYKNRRLSASSKKGSKGKW